MRKMNKLGCNRNKKEDEEPNPKTLHLVKLVQLIEPKILAYYLEQVSIFLKNKKKDLWFPLISPNLDAFLVRMIQDTQNLKGLLHVLDDRNRELAEDIIETIEANRKLYTVVHSYANSNTDKNILVYRKVVDAKPSESSVFDRIERMCNASPVNGSTPDETVERKPPDNIRRSTFPLSFKLQWINATMSFIKDTSVDCLEYPDMSIEQAEFVYSLIRQKKTDNDTDPSIQSVYVPMKKALKDFNVDNEFKATFTYLCGDKVRLSLEKLPLNNNNMKQKPELNGNSNPLDLDNLTKAQKNLARKTNMVKLLEPSFIRTALQMILDFIHEDTEASIVFRNANEEQCAFLQSALAMAKARKLHGVFDEDSRNLLRKIAKLLSTCQYFDLKIDVAKMDRNTSLRTVSLIKTPKEEFRAPTFGPSYKKICNGDILLSYPTNIIKAEVCKNRTLTTSTTHNNAQTTHNGKVSPKCQTTNNIKTEKDLKDFQNTNIKIKKEEIKENTTVKKEETKTASSICIPNGVETIENKTQIKAEKEKIPDIEQKSTKDSSKSVDTVDFKTISKKTIEPAIKSNSSKSVDTVDTSIDKKTTEQAKAINNDNKSTLDGLKPAGTIDVKTIDTNDKKSALDGLKPAGTVDVQTIDKKTIEQEKTTNNKAINPVQALRDRSEGKLGLRKTRLIEGLSTPLESDVAMRMMRQMGWEGGALGARGEGLLEPVMPAIHLKAGAGLGHVVPKKEPKAKPQKPPPLKPAQPQPQPEKPQNQVKPLSKTIHCHKPPNIRLDLLRHIFLLVTEEAQERVIVYSTKLAKKEMKFLENTIKVLLRRGALIFNDDLMQNVYDRIKETMVSEPELQLSCFIGGDKRHLTFQKIIHQSRVSNSSTEPKVNSVEPKNNNNNNVVSKETKENDKNDVSNVNDKDNAKNDAKTVYNNDIIVISGSDDSESVKKGSGKSDAKGVGGSQNSSFESEFEKEIKEVQKAISDADKEEIKVDDKKTSEEAKKYDEKPTECSNGACSKRLRSNSDDSIKNQKKNKINESIKYLGIAPDSYPMENVGVDEIITFQNKICEKLDKNNEKPLLECLGIKNGAIIYCCHNEFGRFLIESVANDMNLKTINITNLYKNRKYKMKARINSYVEVDLKNLLNKVEDYNGGLKTDLWSVTNVQGGTGHVTISLEIDEKSFDFISENNFSIFAGVDKLRFNVSWD
ncbi:hypothetical protein ABMA28_011146 [Loxostege sticticalis]|uniref:G-patch domain-containing protein n=1 Tax=Loxostege sticticalis TaxID=481309 RepID=A0ABD0S6C0_LOXSC